MSQYTENVQQFLKAIEYLDEGKKFNALEAANGKLIVHYNHGGYTITILRDQVYNDVEYKKGDVIEFPPTDPYYIALTEKYNNYKPIKLWAGVKKWCKSICLMLK